ncbi:MAG: glycosyltransferase [Candidatus Saccharimonadales bacterium]
MKIAVITCYRNPDFVRAQTLRAALKLVPGVKTVVVKNRYRGIWRYAEVIYKVWQARRQQQPDAYLLTYRGQEILPFILLIAWGKPVYFDEFVVPVFYAASEYQRHTFVMIINRLLARLSRPFYRLWLWRCEVILADTTPHAELSARVNHTNLRKYLVVPVGADEKLFKPVSIVPTEKFRVFYYGATMLPLYGVDTILAAAELLKDNTEIEFLIAGNPSGMHRAVKSAQSRGANIQYFRHLSLQEIPGTLKSCNLALGGPFGNTPLAERVVTNKTYQSTASAVPLVIGDSLANREYFTDKQTALIVPLADAVALAKTISWASGHPSELMAVALAGRKLYEKSFSTAALARRLQRLA